jgi:hypothetical protein
MHEANRPEGFTFQQVVELCRQHELFEEDLPTNDTARKANTKFSRRLKKYDGREFPDHRIFSVQGKGHNRRYHVHTQAAEPEQVTTQPPAVPPTPAPKLE